jgi:hypothetical protein
LYSNSLKEIQSKISKSVQTESNFHHIAAAFINLTVANQEAPDFFAPIKLNIAISYLHNVCSFSLFPIESAYQT